MIEFDCPHCGIHYRVDKDFGGRHGWCRTCKGFIVVPTARSGVRWEDQPAEQRLAQLERLLKNTSELYHERGRKVREYHTRLKALMEESEQAKSEFAARLEQVQLENERLTRELAEAAEANGTAESIAQVAARERDAATESLAESEQAREALAAELIRVRDRLRAVAVAETERDALAADNGTLRRRLAECEEDLQRLRESVEADGAAAGVSFGESLRLQQQVDEARAARDEAVASHARLETHARDIEKRMANAEADAARWREDAERLAQVDRRLTEVQAKWEEAQALLRELHPALAAAHEARGRAESESAEASARAARLEETVNRLQDDVETQRTAVAESRREAEQARSAARSAEGEAEAAREVARRKESEIIRLREAELKAAMVPALIAERDQFRDRLVESEAQGLRLREELAAIANETAASGSERAQELETMLEEMDRVQRARSDLENRVTELTAEMHRVQMQLDKTHIERDHLADQLAELQEKAARFDALVDDLAKTQARLEESQIQVQRLTDLLARAGGPIPYERGGSAGRLRGYAPPIIPESEPHGIALVPELLDEGGPHRGEEIMASMLRFIQPPDDPS